MDLLSCSKSYNEDDKSYDDENEEGDWGEDCDASISMPFDHKMNRTSECTNQRMEDKIGELIRFQNSNGVFNLSSDEWKKSLFEEYAGGFVDVQSFCPVDLPLDSWITAIAIKIFEMKMSTMETLWKLVVQKSKTYLKKVHGNDYQKYLEKAQELIMKV